MKNCRNCKHADWFKINGRRRFGNWAECTVEIDDSFLPESAWKAKEALKETRSVASHDNKEINCSRWEKI